MIDEPAHRSLYLRLLGDFQLDDSAVPEQRIVTPRLQSLIAYLVLHRDTPQPRQHLAFVLWSDSPETRARNSLRQLLFDLRASIPESEHVIRSDRLTLQWQPDPRQIIFTCDVDVFEQGTRAESPSALRAAIEVYRGDLLRGLYDEWVLAERERLRSSFWNMLRRLTTLLEGDRAYAEAIPYVERQIRDDPLYEPAYERLMRLHALNGSRASALQVYHQCVTVLQRELGAEPGQALRAAYARVTAGPADQRTAIGKAEQQTQVHRLIGRKSEWATLRETWRSAVAGRPHIAVLTGEPGIGKTRLAEELVSWATRQGIVTATAHCYADAADGVYAPIATWLRSPTIFASLQELDPIWLSELARILPELLTTHPNLPAPGPLSERWQLMRFHDALIRAIVSNNDQLLLFLDDIQWCDAETLTLLPSLLRSPFAKRLLLVTTLRLEELSDTHPIYTFRPAFQHDGTWIELPLTPFTEDETKALASQAVGHPLTQASVAWVYRETEGNPLFVVELVNVHLRVANPQSSQLLSASEAPLPTTIQTVIETRLASLAPHARLLVGAAAVIGRAFSTALLTHVLDDPDDDTLVRGLDELWHRRIIREKGAQAYDFTHDKLRAVAYSGLSPARRRQLHRRAARALELEYAGTLDTVTSQIALHYERAGDINQAVRFYHQAAAAARRVYATLEATGYLRQALTLIDTESHPVDRNIIVDILESLADLLRIAAQPDQAVGLYGRAQAMTPADDILGHARLRRKRGDAFSAWYQSQHAMHEYGQASQALGPPRPITPENDAWWREWLDIHIAEMWVHYQLAQVDVQEELAARIRPVAERIGSPEQLYRFLHSYKAMRQRRERYRISDATLALGQDTLAAAEQVGDLEALANARFGLGFTCLWHQDVTDAQEHFQAAIPLIERVGDARLRVQCLTYQAISYRLQTDVAETQSYATQALEAAQAAQLSVYVGAANANLAWVAWRQGDANRAKQLGTAGLEQMRKDAVEYPFLWLALFPLMAAALAKQHIDAAIGYARVLFEPLQQPLPDELARTLAEAISAFEHGETNAASTSLQLALSSYANGYL